MKKILLVIGVLCLLVVATSAMADNSAVSGAFKDVQAGISGEWQHTGQVGPNIAVPAVPEPMSMMLGLIGLSSVVGLRRLRKRAA